MLLINRTLLRMSRGVRHWILIIAGLKMLVLVGTARFAQSMSHVLGSLTVPQAAPNQIAQAILAAFWASLVVLVGEVLVGEAEYRCTAKARLSLRRQIMSQVLLLDVGNIEKIGASSAVASAVDGVESMQIYYSKYLPGLLYSLAAPFYLFFRLRQASLSAAVFLLVVTCAILPVNSVFRSVVQKLKTDYWSSFRGLTAYFLESLRSLTTLKLFNQDELRTRVLQDKADDFNAKVMDVMKVNFSSFLLTDGIIYLSAFGAVVIVCTQLISGQVELPAALMVLMLGYSFFTSIRQLMNATHQALTGVAAAQNIAALLDIDVSRPSLPPSSESDNAYAGIAMESVSYSYAGRKTVLDRVSIQVPRGQVTALVGQSGCGKSTVAGLLLRFFDPDSGRITIDGVDYLRLSPDQLRGMVIMVPQSVSLFSGTIASNLRIAAPEATEEQLLDALAQVRLKDWVMAQPAGLQTDVGDAGGKLSGGQRQKIGIARALLSNAPYIVFDEATSSVDIDSEREIWATIADLALTRTLLIISHRLSTIRQADNIYVLQVGRVAEQGDHGRLMENVGLYSRLVAEQAVLEQHGERRLRHA